MPDPSPVNPHRSKLVFALVLVAMFGGAYYIAPPQSFLGSWDGAPPVPLDQRAGLPVEVPDFASITDVEMKKQVFFEFLQPYVDAQNGRVQRQREQLLSIIDKLDHGLELSRNERLFLRTLSTEYEMEGGDYRDPAFLDRLLRRVDVLPPSLVLSQAAIESGWGTSRFALEAYNFFGQWCYAKGCGLVPSRRGASASHEVKAFENVEEAVRAYFMNLNTFPSYLDLRLIRETLRESARPIDGISLSRGLESYSERGDAYISELQDMIRFNDLQERDAQLTPLQQD